MSRRSFARVAALATSALYVAIVAVAAGPQQQAISPVRPIEKAGPVPPALAPTISIPRRISGRLDATKLIVDKLIDAYDIKPHPLPSIPDDPPPHEGAMIDHPLVVEPPDMLLVEVLEALPGRPISGERLVQPDGTIDLGFYGQVHVRGLTIPQIKVAVIKRIRKVISDETLGLVTMQVDEAPPPRREAKPLILPDAKENPLDPPDRNITAPPSQKPQASLGPRRLQGATLRAGARPFTIRPVRSPGHSQEPEEKKAGEKSPDPLVIPLPSQGQIKITIDVQGQDATGQTPGHPDEAENTVPGDLEGNWTIVEPQDSDHVFVCITAFNSKSYYILGDLCLGFRTSSDGREPV
jgi:hypothetical protein